MIDWATFKIPCYHLNRIEGGRVIKVSPDGLIEWETVTSHSVIGSYDSSIRIKTSDVNSEGYGTHLYVDGNPLKFLQGHNLFGIDNLVSLIQGLMIKLWAIEELGLRPTMFDINAWEKGFYRLTRVDCTFMYDVETPDNANAWIRQAEQCATLSHRGKGQITSGSTLYFGKHSRRAAVKFYPKGQEFRKHAHNSLLEIPSLVEYADKALRVEVVLRSMELQRRLLNVASNWDDNISYNVVNGFLRNLHMSEIEAIAPSKTENLRPVLKAVYELWKAGHDIRGMYPRPTFYRYRKALMEALDVDIGLIQPSNRSDTTNVVRMVKIIEAKPMGIPDWAYGTDLLFQPSK